MDPEERLARAKELQATMQPMLRELGDIMDSLDDVTYARQRDGISEAIGEMYGVLETITSLSRMVRDQSSRPD